MYDREFETIEWTFEEGTGIGTIALDRPDSLNALSSRLRDEIVAGVEAFEGVRAFRENRDPEWQGK